MKCKNCKNKNSNGIEVCSYCGMELPPTSKKSKWLASILCFTFGSLGLHRFYVGKWKTGSLMLFMYAILRCASLYILKEGGLFALMDSSTNLIINSSRLLYYSIIINLSILWGFVILFIIQTIDFFRIIFGKFKDSKRKYNKI